MSAPHTVFLDTPFSLKGLDLKNRIVMAPMCQYSVTAKDGKPNDWHFVHYTARAIGGVGLVIVEMTDVEPDGRITNNDLGLWSDDHIPAFSKLVAAVKSHGAKIGIQIAHAGRKAQDAPVPVAPSALAYSSKYKTPRALTTADVKAMVGKFQDAARRAVAAGFDLIELHGAHGYLMHQFHSPAINQRDDVYGQDLMRFGVEVIHSVKQVMPADMPLALRISAVEYGEGGYDADYGIALSRRYVDAGVDVLHVSSGGDAPVAEARRPSVYPGYMLPLARNIKRAVDVPVIGVGLLDEPVLAQAALANGDVDLAAIGRGLLRAPHWALNAIQATRATAAAPTQYKRAYL